MTGSPRRFTRERILVSTRLLPNVVRQVLDVPAERLAAVIGAWPEPALLESGTDPGDAGQWSILTAYPRLVWEATGGKLVFAHGQRPVRTRPGRCAFPSDGAAGALRAGAAGRSRRRLAPAISGRDDRLLRL